MGKTEKKGGGTLLDWPCVSGGYTGVRVRIDVYLSDTCGEYRGGGGTGFCAS